MNHEACDNAYYPVKAIAIVSEDNATSLPG